MLSRMRIFTLSVVVGFAVVITGLTQAHISVSDSFLQSHTQTPTEFQEVTASWLEYENTDLGLFFSYPPEWRVVEELAPPDFSPDIVHIFSWSEDEDPLSETDAEAFPTSELKVDIVIIPNEEGLNSQEFVSTYGLDVSDDLTSLESRTPIVLSGDDWVRLDWIYSDGTPSIVYVATNRHNGYIVTVIPANSELIDTFDLLLSTVGWSLP